MPGVLQHAHEFAGPLQNAPGDLAAGVSIPAVASASVLHSAPVGGSVVGVVMALYHLGSLTAANWVSRWCLDF